MKYFVSGEKLKVVAENFFLLQEKYQNMQQLRITVIDLETSMVKIIDSKCVHRHSTVRISMGGGLSSFLLVRTKEIVNLMLFSVYYYVIEALFRCGSFQC